MLNQVTLRTPENQKRYMEFLKNNKNRRCFICDRELLVKEYKNFIIIKNKFPYNRIFAQHFLICPKRHISQIFQLNISEIKELEKILSTFDYDMIFWNNTKYQSHKSHIHLHLCKLIS